MQMYWFNITNGSVNPSQLRNLGSKLHEMKTLKKLGLLLLFTPLLFAAQTQTSTEQEVSFESAVQKDDIVQVTLSATNPFIVGANRYVLHSGSKFFLRNTHPEGNESKIMFFIPLDDFNSINGSSDLVLVYGLYESNKYQDGSQEQIVGYEGLNWKVNGVVTLNTESNE